MPCIVECMIVSNFFLDKNKITRNVIFVLYLKYECSTMMAALDVLGMRIKDII